MLARVVVAVVMTASMLPSGWVFCMEATGDVRAEYATGLCCTNGKVVAGEAVNEPPAEACEGCRDIALECSAHREPKREPASTAILTSYVECPGASVEPRPFAAPKTLARSTLSRLSSVVIRC
jgi:hypothetical protein